MLTEHGEAYYSVLECRASCAMLCGDVQALLFDGLSMVCVIGLRQKTHIRTWEFSLKLRWEVVILVCACRISALIPAELDLMHQSVGTTYLRWLEPHEPHLPSKGQN